MKRTYTKMIFLLAIQIIALGIIMMVVSYFTDYLKLVGFFGDHLCAKGQVSLDGDTIEWGYRHWVYWWCGFFLFCLSLVRLIIWAVNYSDKITEI